MVDSETGSTRTSRWTICYHQVPSQEVIFFTQVILIYIVVCVSLTNITLSADNRILWSSLLSGCLGYLLPNPKIVKQNESVLPNTP